MCYLTPLLYYSLAFYVIKLCVGISRCDFNSNLSVMNCTARHVNIKDICNHVRINNAAVLLAGENNFGKLSRDDLKGCERLVNLDLHYNQIGSLDEDVFADFQYLKELNLRANDINFYDESFSQSYIPENVTILDIGGNWKGNASATGSRYPNVSRLKSLQSMFLDGFPADFGPEYQTLTIREVSLSGKSMYTYCNLTRITNNTFANLISVQILDISCCSVRYISAGAFEKLAKLERLDLSVNERLGFEMLSSFTYGLQFTNIRVLDYSRVHSSFGLGTKITKRHMCYLWNTSLTELNLDKNRIALFETNALILTPKTLETVSLNYNRPTFGPYVSQLGCLTNVTYMYLSFQNNYYSPLEYMLCPYPDIDGEKVISPECPFMTESSLRQIAAQKGSCQFLEETDFAHMFTPTLPPKVKVLTFHNSKIDYKIPLMSISIEPRNNSLEELDISDNNMFWFAGTIGPFPHLKKVDFSNNYCVNITENVFDGSLSLEQLILSNNYLGSVLSTNPKIFSKLSSLKELYLANNQITVLHPELFSSLTQLQSLYLDSNNIHQFSLDMTTLGNLLNVDLSYNYLRTLPVSFGQQLNRNAQRHNSTFTIDLEGNILDFNCNNTRFLQWLFQNRIHMEHYQNYTYLPQVVPELNRTSLHRLRVSCRSYTLLIVLGSVALAAFISIAGFGIIYRNRWKIRYFVYMSKTGLCCAKKHTGYENLKEYRFDAFISYAEENIAFVKSGIIRILEDDIGLKLCIHQRDFVAGRPITDNIVEAINNSRKSVVILSNDFLKKKWCMYEFNMARMEAIYSRDRNHLVVVILEDVPAKDMPLEMLEWIRGDSYIQYTTDEHGEALFWNKLKEAITM